MKISNLIFSFCIFALVACAYSNVKQATTASECEDVSNCKVSGVLEMKSDGHGFIGYLQLSDGTCVNVSLPEGLSKSLVDKPPVMMEVQGPVLPFPNDIDVIGFEVNGRRVGFGNCGNFYIFVRGEKWLKLSLDYKKNSTEEIYKIISSDKNAAWPAKNEAIPVEITGKAEMYKKNKS